MKTHQLIQGSPEWHAYRAEHFNASDAPAMLGCSPYETRTELMRRIHTGLAVEVDAGTQRRFDDGHRFEALARPLAEEIIGEELYPVTGSEGKYSASFDGLTMLGDTAFEHKTLNDELRAVMVDGCTGADLPKNYRVQMEQQCLVSGCNRVLFMASKWNGDELVEERHCWYSPDADLRAQIVGGWAQLEQDMASYVPEAAADPKPVGRAPEALPALSIQVTGAVTASNLSEFKDHALAVFKGINRNLSTDSDFADAERTVKWCEDVEGRLKAAKEHALGQTASIDALFKAIDDIAAEARTTRLELDKLVKARKEQIRQDIVTSGAKSLRDHIMALDNRIGRTLMPTIPADFAGAVKGKRTIDSLKNAVSEELARAKIEASAVADRIQINLRTLEQRQELAFLFPDVQQLVLKQPDDLAAVFKSRITDHEVKEAERIEAIRKEEAEKLQREAEAKAQAEQAVQQAASRTTEHTLATAPPSHQTVVPAAVADSGTRIKLGEINARLAPIQITADGLESMGFAPVGKEGAAKLYRESDFVRICAALVRHINNACTAQPA